MRPYWQNPEIQQLNRLPARSPLFAFENETSAVSTAAKGCEHSTVPDTSWYQSLDGSWQFALMDAPEQDADGSAFSGWQKPSFDAGDWKQIQVPLTWTLQGYDKPHYTNVQMPNAETFPYTPEHNPTGLYRLPVTVNRSWRDRRVVLHVGSAESCLLVYVNGEFIGLSKDTRLPAEFDITESISWEADGDGKALIALKVVRYSDATFVEDQDQWWFGGIHRSVYLYSTEQTFIGDVEALTSVHTHHGKTTGSVKLTVPLGYQARGSKAPTKPELDALRRTVRYALYELTGATSAQPAAGEKVAELCTTLTYDYRMNEAKARAVLSFDAPKLWSSETPNLYVLSVSLYEGGTDTDLPQENASSEGLRLIESTACTLGFKTVTIENRELRINGKKVYIHGVNRHEHNEQTGKTLTVEQMKRDILLLKQYNFNAVRTCHYPDDERWYDLCNRYGIYIMDEANIENHAYYDYMCRSDEWTNAYMQRVMRMYRRDKNNACIFCWSLGNESGAAQNQDAQAAWLHHVDPTRIVHYEGYSRPEFRQSGYTTESFTRGRGVVDLVSPMYPTIDLITEFADTVDDPRPLIMCEYSHAMGNANGSLADYWKAIESHHGLQGGFIWDWIDQGIKATDENGRTYWKYGGDFGDEPTDYDFCINGLLFPDQTPKPAMEECRYLFAPVRLHEIQKAAGRFEIENRFDFTTLDVLKAHWSLLKNGTVIADGTLALPALKPDERAPLSFPVGEALAKAADDTVAGEIVLTVDFIYARETIFAKEGSLCTRAGFVLQASPLALSADEITTIAGDAKAAQPATAGKDRTSELTALFENAQPQLFRALIENECIKAHLDELGISRHHIGCGATEPWLYADLLNLQAEKNGTLKTGAKACNGMEQKVLGRFNKKITPFTTANGTSGIMLDLAFTLNDVIGEYPRVGITLPVTARFETARWYGRGPQENYNDRQEGAFIGTYALPIKALETPYIVPQENGTRTDVRALTLTAGDGEALHIAAATPFAFSISRYTTADLWKCNHPSELTDTTENGGFYTLNIDLAHRGVGTGVCGPDTMEAYRVYPGTYSLRLYIW